MAAQAWVMRRLLDDLGAINAALLHFASPPPPADPLDVIEPFDLLQLPHTTDADFERMLTTPPKLQIVRLHGAAPKRKRGRPRNEVVALQPVEQRQHGSGTATAARPSAKGRGKFAGHREKAPQAKPPARTPRKDV